MGKNVQEKLVCKLYELESFLSTSTEYAAIVAELIEKYIVCEVCYKALLMSYRTDKGKSTKESDQKINFSEVKSVLHYFHYPVREDIIRKILSSETKKGKKSMKILRDQILHNMSAPAVKEAVERQDELHRAMDFFLNLFRDV